MNFDMVPIPIEIPSELTLPDLLLVDALSGACQAGVEIIKKHISRDEIKQEYDNWGGKTPADFGISELKERLLIDSLQLLVDAINQKYISKLENLDLTNAILWQVVEIDWTYQDLCPGDTEIHLEVFTKRDIFLENELHEATGIRIIREDS